MQDILSTTRNKCTDMPALAHKCWHTHLQCLHARTHAHAHARAHTHIHTHLPLPHCVSGLPARSVCLAAVGSSDGPRLHLLLLDVQPHVLPHPPTLTPGWQVECVIIRWIGPCVKQQGLHLLLLDVQPHVLPHPHNMDTWVAGKVREG